MMCSFKQLLKKFTALTVLCVAIISLNACTSVSKKQTRAVHKKTSVSKTRKRLARKTCRPSYTIKGVRYCVLHSSKGFKESGIASWYGPGFHGKKTANGKIYYQDRLTAAHKTLPFGTRVRVTNLQNKRTVTVKITDRGPFHPGRIIDLSKKAAKTLGIRGTARVTIRALAKY